MTRATPISDTVTLHVPFRIVKRGGRKEMQLPLNAAAERKSDNTLIKAIARAHRWQRMLESGECGSISELAEAEKINRSYVCRVLRLSLLAPEIVEAILDGRQAEGADLRVLMRPFPVAWPHQLSRFRGSPSKIPVDQTPVRD